MSLSKFNQMWYDMGRKACIEAHLAARANKTIVMVPQSSHNATAFNHWRNGWNSILADDLKNYGLSAHIPKKFNTLPSDPITHARNIIRGTQ